MKNPEELREISDKVLFGLTADDSLKQRILQNAVSTGRTSSRKLFSPIPAFCTVIAMLLITVGVLNSIRPVDPAATVEMNVFSAGSVDISPSPDASDSVFPAGFQAETVVSVELAGRTAITDPQKCRALTDTLMNCTVSDESPDMNDAVKMTILCDNGDRYHYNASDPYISDDSHCWSCENFFSLCNEYFNE